MKLNPFADAKYVNTIVGPGIFTEPYSIPKSITNTKYLEIVYDQNDYPSPVNPYETPISTLNNDQSPINVQNNNVNLSSVDLVPKNRTISTSSTVSETSVFHPVQPNGNNNNNNNLVTKNLTLTVALPNSKEDCTSNEKLLMTSQPHTIHTPDNSTKKLQQLYANSNIEHAIRNSDGITSM